MYDALQVANWFVGRFKEEGRPLTIMTLLKLVYFAHAWYLEMFKLPLIANRIEAWRYGPVIPDVYNAFRKQGVELIQKAAQADEAQFTDADKHVLEEIFRIYGSMPFLKLSKIIHEPGNPCDEVSKRWGYFAPIPDRFIKHFYEEKRQQNRA